MTNVFELTKFTASGKVLRLVMDIAAALERYKIAPFLLKALFAWLKRLRRITPDKGGRWEVAK